MHNILTLLSHRRQNSVLILYSNNYNTVNSIIYNNSNSNNDNDDNSNKNKNRLASVTFLQ